MIKNKVINVLVPIVAVLVALLIGAGIIGYLGESPAKAYGYLFSGAFSGERAIARTLLEATPMIFTGLAVLFAFRGGMFNIGAQGQMMMSGLTAAAIGGFITNVFISNPVVILIVGGFAGFIWAGIAGILKAKLGIHEVISTIMLNYIAMSFEQYCLNYPLKAPGTNPQTPPVIEAARLGKLLDIHVPLNYGFILALVAVVIVWFILEKTVLGYEIKAVGYNPSAAENNGINVKLIIVLVLGISGFLAGLGGVERVLGGVGQFSYKQGITATYGFDGIAVALLGKNTPVGTLLAAILFAALRVGGRAMQFNTNVPSQIVIMIQAIIILLIAADNMIRKWLEKAAKKGEEI
ncbi:simple sugar transport system permease protein [Cetobacterium ceti]|uniref:Simple sugar transport system permease protein n=1 Tax=Cetobacterium ceti TaxID=180163 RepID=A0A1T4KSQ6_9FUSO|nr:ABC transporter permease [Cetobacterium ceti]SJZ45456.1 simple sugar transport system permease protein [Cetobacterium ceti]